MGIIPITFLVLANVFVYIRKVILFRKGYKVGWMITWSDFRQLIEVIDKTEFSLKRRLLILLNISPMMFFLLAILLIIIENV